ncbi:hypothetical protein B0H13DRAFT_2091805 [Mycena leptocephala]|nr:hypothetical protein B0H13DRAFT_2091805 [Mycena leptocephala]
MVIAHKLRKMDNLDIERTREDEQAEKTSQSAQEQQAAESSSSKGDEALENASVPPLRPLTRSLTGRASKPRARDDSWYQPPKKSPAGRKKAKSPRKRTIDEVDRAESEEPQDPPPAPEPTVPPLNSTQAIFVDASGDPSKPASLDTRISRTRTNLPIPVPNLIKKSRGRRVPIIAASNGEDEANKRLHVCKVEGCGKCFHRGEHLKRHIRSIHTHEKPFPCTFPSCHKFFNRHDNLLQHVKVHRNSDDDIDAEGSPAPDDSPPPSPVTNSFQVEMRAAALPLHQHQHSTAITYPTLGAPMTFLRPTTQPSSYATNMAVSSLRTELPDSPAKGAQEEPSYGVQQHQEHDHDHDHDQDDDDEGEDDGDGEGEHYEEQPSGVVEGPPPQAAHAGQEYVFPEQHGGDMQAQANGQVDGKGEQQQQQHEHQNHPSPGPVMQLPNQTQSYYRLRTPPAPLAMAMAQPQEWQQAQAQATF